MRGDDVPFLDGSLSAAEVKEAERHLEHCHWCAKRYRRGASQALRAHRDGRADVGRLKAKLAALDPAALSINPRWRRSARTGDYQQLSASGRASPRLARLPRESDTDSPLPGRVDGRSVVEAVGPADLRDRSSSRRPGLVSSRVHLMSPALFSTVILSFHGGSGSRSAPFSTVRVRVRSPGR